MATAIPQKSMTAGEFMELPDRHIELNDGKVVHFMPSLLAQSIPGGEILPGFALLRAEIFEA